MKKEVKLKDNRVIELDSNLDNGIKEEIITEKFSNDEIISAHYMLKRGTSLSFSAKLDNDYENEENQSKLIFSFDLDHPLYFPLIHLLDGKNEYVLEDENNSLKYLKIFEDYDIVNLVFTDKSKENNKSHKFEIILSNKLEPYKDRETREKNKKKIALNYFFDESSKVLEDGYYQINDIEYDSKVKKLLKENVS